MLETFRKHHYILMLLIAIVVVISFTFLSKPYDRMGGAGGSMRVFTLYNADVTISEVESINQEMRIAAQLVQLSQDRESRGADPAAVFYEGMNSIDNTERPTDKTSIDLDPAKNILVMRHECDKLGIDVEREDLEKFVKEIGAFKTNGGFDSRKLNDFLNGGAHGDRNATETKLFATLRDVMRFQRLAQLVGGTFPPSKAEVDADYAEKNQKITAATVLINKKVFEEQVVTDEDIQKFYDGERAKQEAPKPAEEPKKGTPPPPPPPAADPIVLSDEKRTVKYVYTELAKAPVPPTPPPPLPPLGDISSLPEDQKKAKEEEHKKQEEENKKKQEEYTKANEEYQKKMTEYGTSKTNWLKNVENLSNALANTEERGTKSFDDVAKELKFEVKTATFTKGALPEELKKINSRGTAPAEAIFSASKEGGEDLLEDSAQTSFAFFKVAEIEKASLLPLDQVKQKISDKLKAEKVTAALKAAGDSTRSNILESLKAGKSFKDAVEEARAKTVEVLKKEKTFKEADAAAVLTTSELPSFTKSKPLSAVPNSSTITNQARKLNPGDLSQPETVSDGLLLVYVEKKELPKHPEMEQQKKDMSQNHTFHDAAASPPGGFNQENMQEMIDKYEYFSKHGGYTNPVLKAWFTDSRRTAESVTE